MKTEHGIDLDRFQLLHSGRRLRYGIGCAWLGSPGDESFESAQVVLRRAYEAGFRYFDTAQAYRESELRVGAFLLEVPRESVFLASKMNFPDTVRGVDQIREGVLRSLERLQTSWLDLFQIHDIEVATGLFDNEESVDKAARLIASLKEEGLIRHFGLATRALGFHLAAMKTGLFDCHLTYNDLTPIAPMATTLFPDAKRFGAVLINGSPLSSGMLRGVDPTTLVVHASGEERRLRAQEFYRHCQAFGLTPLSPALQFPLRFPDVKMNLTGPRSLQELESSLDALNTSVPEELWNSWI